MLTTERPHLAFLLHDTSRLFRARFDERARALGVTRQQWRVLFNLARTPGQTQAEVADGLEVERITLCRMVDRLGEARLVERRGDPADRRVWRLHLTESAQEIVGQLAAIGSELETEMLAVLTREEQDLLFGTLGRVAERLRRRDDTKAVA